MVAGGAKLLGGSMHCGGIGGASWRLRVATRRDVREWGNCGGAWWGERSGAWDMGEIHAGREEEQGWPEVVGQGKKVGG